MKQISVALLICFSLLSKGQSSVENKGIIFDSKLSWVKILEKAKAENKYIFVDCYATWCKPCKWMDQNVYSNDTVGDYVNPRFISVKVQMDTSKLDDKLTKAWYKDAHEMLKTYKVNSFPTYLFFSPSGEIVHQDVGTKTVTEFVTLGTEAVDPNKQYFALLNKYKTGQIDSFSMVRLAFVADRFGDRNIAMNIANEYISRYLLSGNNLYSQDNVRFIGQFTRHSTDKGFSVLYHNSEKVNKILAYPGYSQSLISYIISKEEIDSITKAAEKSATLPKWDLINFNIKRKYNKYYAERTILEAQKRWYRYKKDYPEATRYSIACVTKYGNTMTNWDLNGEVWYIVKHSQVKKELEAASRWMQKVVATEKDRANLLPASLDTYANLLYKLGEKEKAIMYEERALKLAIEYKIPNFTMEFQARIEKMKRGEKIW